MNNRPRHSRKAKLLKLAWVVWLGGVVAGSLLLLDEKQLTRTVGSIHRMVHIVAFAGITLGIWLWPNRSAQKVAASAGVFSLGMLTELAQSYYYQNAYEWADVLDDGIGVLAGVLLPVLLTLTYTRLRCDATKTGKRPQ